MDGIYEMAVNERVILPARALPKSLRRARGAATRDALRQQAAPRIAGARLVARLREKACEAASEAVRCRLGRRTQASARRRQSETPFANEPLQELGGARLGARLRESLRGRIGGGAAPQSVSGEAVSVA